MASFHRSKIKTFESIAPGSTVNFTWNNPPGGLVSYVAVPDPPTASGPHGTSSGRVEVTRWTHTYTKDNYNGNSSSVTVYVKNSGSNATGADVYQNWFV
jgi:hypothetical protein